MVITVTSEGFKLKTIFLTHFAVTGLKHCLSTVEETNHLTYFCDHIYASKDRTGLFLNSVRKY